jgi:hypothetical protein
MRNRRVRLLARSPPATRWQAAAQAETHRRSAERMAQNSRWLGGAACLGGACEKPPCTARSWARRRSCVVLITERRTTARPLPTPRRPRPANRHPAPARVEPARPATTCRTERPGGMAGGINPPTPAARPVNSTTYNELDAAGTSRLRRCGRGAMAKPVDPVCGQRQFGDPLSAGDEAGGRGQVGRCRGAQPGFARQVAGMLVAWELPTHLLSPGPLTSTGRSPRNPPTSASNRGTACWSSARR